MPEYIVTTPCYVPVGNGTRFKRTGQRVTLDKKEAESLDGYVELVDANGPGRWKPEKKSEKPAGAVGLPIPGVAAPLGDTSGG